MATVETITQSLAAIEISGPPPDYESSQHHAKTIPESKNEDSFVEEITSTSHSPAQPVNRIEDSFEALDQLEEELEAFDEAAHLRSLVASGNAKGQNAQNATPSKTNAKSAAQPKTPNVKPGASSVRVKTRDPKRQSVVRKSTTMADLDVDQPNETQQTPAQDQSKKSTVKGVASLLPPKPPAKSAKPPTVPSFELPGEVFARRLKEQREARKSVQLTTGPAPVQTPTTLRRTKSSKPPTRPTFELPGEAISRRKREEHQARLKAQEEEERKRRAFKARPVRSSIVPSTLPRETLASRARTQPKEGLAENTPQRAGSNASKRASVVISARSPLANTNNQPANPRGRNVNTEAGRSTSHVSRATSSSTGSLNGQRSSVSVEDAQHQRLRGKEIWQRDNSYLGERERAKKDREDLARIAREEAAERSRQKSRDWAEKQKRKSMTLSSLRDIAA